MVREIKRQIIVKVYEFFLFEGCGEHGHDL